MIYTSFCILPSTIPPHHVLVVNFSAANQPWDVMLVTGCCSERFGPGSGHGSKRQEGEAVGDVSVVTGSGQKKRFWGEFFNMER